MNELYNRIKDSEIKSLFFLEELYNFDIDKKCLNKMLNELVTKAEIFHIKGNIYALGKILRKELISKQILSNMLVPNSYVSKEFLLSRISWIPENVYVVTCVTNEKESEIKTNFGYYEYINIPQKKYFSGVEKYTEDNYFFYKAKPLKALTDMICDRKYNWTTLYPLYHSLRIEYENLETLTSDDFDELQDVYEDKNAENFLNGIRKELAV
ncbi:MAG: hypothetical protein FWD47_14895 [Treponema sp.]|nr:hypothetical protein [Treponema sp.]